MTSDPLCPRQRPRKWWSVQQRVTSARSFIAAGGSSLLLLLLLASGARAGLLTATSGNLMLCSVGCVAGCARDAQTAGTSNPNTGSCAAGATPQPSTDYIMPDGAAMLFVTLAANSSTLALEQSLDNGASWITTPSDCTANGSVCGGTGFVQSVNGTNSFKIMFPTGRYRPSLAVYGGGTVNIKYRFVRLTTQ